MSHGSHLNPLLQVEHLTMRFGGLLAIDDVSFTIEANRISAIIGPNGAGKTTLFNCLTGFYKPSIGRMTLRHKEKSFLLERMEGHAIAAQARIARSFQNIRLFANMSVLENLMVAQHNRLIRASGYSIWGLLGLSIFRRAEQKAGEQALYWLERMGLAQYADNPAGSLPYGVQRKVEIARALCTDPVLLCLDEPAAGLNPAETAELTALLQAICRQHHLTILLIEHDMSMVMKMADHIIVLDHGCKIADAQPDAIRQDPAVIKAYLGEEDDDPLPAEIAEDIAQHREES